MADDPRPIPPAVQQALARGHLIEAIRLLREERGLGLAEAKHLVESLAQSRPTQTPPPPAPEQGTFGHTGMPAAAADALARGKKIEAIRLYRAHAKVDLRQAKEAVEAYAAQHPLQVPGLAPGEVPRRSGRVGWIVGGILAGLLAAAWLRD